MITQVNVAIAKAKLLLNIYKGNPCTKDGIWVNCGNCLYKEYLAKDLVKEGLLEEKETEYIPSQKYYVDIDIMK